jgi:hypothetical protein
MVVVALATRLPAFGNPVPEFDEQLYTLIGVQMDRGLLPYADLWDRKPPGLFLIYAAAHAIGGPSPVAYQVVGLLACLVGGWQVWRLALHVADRRTAALAAPLYPALMAVFDSFSGQSEIFFAPLLMGMAQLLLAARARALPAARLLCLAAMALGGVALQVKYTAVAQCLFFGLCALWLLHRKGRSLASLAVDAALFAALGIAPTLLAVAWFASAGALGDFIFANFVSITLRAAMPSGWLIDEQLVFAVPVVALAAGGVARALTLRRRGIVPPTLWWLALTWLIFAVAGLFIVRTIYTYYYGALVPALILVSLPLFARDWRWGLPAWLIVLAGMIAGFNPVGRAFATQDMHRTLAGLRAALAPHVGTQSRCLYVFDGPTALYRLTGSGLPTRFIYPDHLNNVLEARALPVDPAREVMRIFAERPGAVVTSRDKVTPQNPATEAIVARQLAAHYRYLGEWNVQDRPIDVHVRLPDADGLAPRCHLAPGGKQAGWGRPAIAPSAGS